MPDELLDAENLDTIVAYLDQFEKDTTFLDAHRLEWTAMYPDQWVVVYKEELAGQGETLNDALSLAEQKNTPRGRAAIAYLSKEPVSMIL